MAVSSCKQAPLLADNNLCNIQLHELLGSRQHQRNTRGDTWVLTFVVLGTDDECLVRRRIRHIDPDPAKSLGIPATFDDEPLKDYSLSRTGQWVWEVQATYGHVPMTRTGTWYLGRPSSTSMSTIGGTQHITRSIYNIDASSNAPNVNNAIEFDGKAVKGIDTPATSTRWRETWKFSRFEAFGPARAPLDTAFITKEAVEDDYWEVNDISLVERWDQLVGYVHGYDWFIGSPSAAERNVKFRHFQPGSIMFLGATMSQLDQWYYEVTFEFLFARNSWEPLPDTITGLSLRDTSEAAASGKPEIRHTTDLAEAEFSTFEIQKNGHDYIEFHYLNQDQDVEDDNGKITLPIPVSYTMHQTQRYIPFGYLGVPIGAMFQPSDSYEKPFEVAQLNPSSRCLTDAQRPERAGYGWELQFNNNACNIHL
jgi:hypothetical protein